MSFAVFLGSPETPPTAQVQALLLDEPVLSGRALGPLCSQAFGVLFDGLSEADATRIAARLSSLGARAGEESWLTLPPVREVRTVVIDDQRVVFEAPTERYDLEQVAAAALGQVSGSEHEAGIETLLASDRPHAVAGDAAVWMLDLFLRDPSRRIRVQAHRFHYGGLDEPLDLHAHGNFLRLCRRVGARLPSSALGRGMRAVMAGGDPPQYASMAQFERESGHLLHAVHEGERARFPVPEVPAAVDLEAWASALRMTRPDRSASQHRLRRVWIAVQLLTIAAMGLWLLQLLSAMAREQ